MELIVEKAVEVELVFDRIDVGEADEVADDRADRRAAATPDGALVRWQVLVAAVQLVCDLVDHLEDVPVDDEEAGEPVFLDEEEFAFEAVSSVITGERFERAIFAGEGTLADAAEKAVQVGAIGHRVIGQTVGQVAGEVEGAAFGDGDRVRDGSGIAREASGHGLGLFEKELRVGPSFAVRAIQREAMAHSDEHVVQAVPGAHVVVRVVGGDDLEAQAFGEVRHGRDALCVAVNVVVLELDEELIGAEAVAVLGGDRFSSVAVAVVEELGDFALAAAREDDQPLAVFEEPLLASARLVLAGVLEGEAEDAAEITVAFDRLGEDGEVRWGAGLAGLKRELTAGDGLETEVPRRAGVLHGAVEIVVVGDGERGIAKPARADDHLVGAAGAFAERPAGMGMQFGVGDHPNIIEQTFGERTRVTTCAGCVIPAVLRSSRPVQDPREQCAGRTSRPLRRRG